MLPCSSVVLLLALCGASNALLGFNSRCDKQSSCDGCVQGQNPDSYVPECRWCPASGRCHDYYDKLIDECSSGTHALYPRDCPSQCKTAYQFEPVIAKKMFLLCAAVYTNNPQQCLNNGLMSQNFTQSKVFTYDCGFGGDCTALMTVSHTDKAIALAFRGTTTPDQMIDMCTRNIMGQTPVPSGGKAMSYWYQGYAGLAPCFNVEINKLRKQYPDYELWVTGHSLGGAMATIAAGHLAHSLKHDDGIEPNDKLKLVTFGEPRTGDLDFANGLMEYVPYDFRVVLHRDIVAHLPPCIPDVTGVGESQCKGVPGKAYPHHHGTEIWFDNDMKPNDTYKVCSGPPCHEDGLCSNGLFHKYSVLEHLEYYNKNTVGFYMLACRGGLDGGYFEKEGRKVPAEHIPKLSWTREKCQTFPYPQE